MAVIRVAGWLPVDELLRLNVTSEDGGQQPSQRLAAGSVGGSHVHATGQVEPLNTLGVALYRAEQWAEAIVSAQRSIALGADTPHNWLLLAMSHRQINNREKAEGWYKKALARREPTKEAVKKDPILQSFYTEAIALFEAKPTSDEPTQSQGTDDSK